MSAAAQIQEMIQNAVQAVSGEYEARLKALEDKVAALEKGAPAARKTAAPKGTTARAQTATGTGKATGTGA